MKGDYAPDNFTENEVLACLEAAGLKHKVGGRYILTQCPLHSDDHESAQIYKDDWFVKCHAGCEGGRFHITKAFPELRKRNDGRSYAPAARPPKQEPTVKYLDKSGEIMAVYNALPEIPADHYFKNIHIDVLNTLGWRFDAEHNRYFIPYFSRSKKTIPFAQWRNLNPGTNRFNFWKDAKPTLYGTWNLEPGEPIFLVEGASDAATLDYCAVPWIAAPSAASGELVKAMAIWAKENGVKIVYAGDNDEAGNKLKDALDDAGASYRRRQPRNPYKDWAEMFEAEGLESVQDYCLKWLQPEWYGGTPLGGNDVGGTPIGDIEDSLPDERTDLERVQEVFPGAVQLKMVDTKAEQLAPVPPSS